MPLIDVNTFVETTAKIYADDSMSATEKVGRIIIAATEAPTVDAVEVVRCKDCQWWDGYGMCNKSMPLLRSGEEYCSRGERKDKQ